MNRTITVKGEGKFQVSPDVILVTMDLESRHLEYDEMMRIATDAVDRLIAAVITAGFEKDELKTTSFYIQTQHDEYRNDDYEYDSEKKLEGYVCQQGLKLEFDLDLDILSKLLQSIAEADVNPKLDIHFSVKNKDAVHEKLLTEATQDAKMKAEILAKASDVQLNQLISIDYNWSEYHIGASMAYLVRENYAGARTAQSPSIEPDNIEMRSIATFVWEIV
jgi:hypothetical protein